MRCTMMEPNRKDVKKTSMDAHRKLRIGTNGKGESMDNCITKVHVENIC